MVGILATASGESFTGEWREDSRHGHGVVRFPNGETFEAKWENDAPVGNQVPLNGQQIKGANKKCVVS